MIPVVRCLSVHATYGCRHSGDCCTAGWPIPVEPDRLAQARDALASGRLTPARQGVAAFETPRAAPSSTPAVVAILDHACVFYTGRADGACGWQAALGHEALPLACRQFPRVALLTPRGVSITLSHYCPTARALLDARDPLTIVSNPPAFPAGGEYVGLDAREALPPLLRPGMLMDWESWYAWERLSIEAIDRADDAGHALSLLRTAVERVRDWTPGGESLIDRVRSVLSPVSPIVDDHRRLGPPSDRELFRHVLEAVPAGLRPSADALRGTAPSPGARRHFLAAHAFANWTAMLGQGLRSWLRSLEAADALVALGCGVREADLLLRHLADPATLARAFSRSADRPR